MIPITRHRLWQVAVDAVLIAAAWYLAFQLRFDFEVPRYYETMLRDVFDRVPVQLVAGARSRAGWDVPDWALKAAASYTEIPEAGHMVMLEAPDALGTELRRLLRRYT